MAITDNLVGYWNLDEASGTRNDSTAGANHLTDNNTVTGTTGPGAHNASLFTNANLEALTHTNNATLNVSGGAFTVAIWVKLTSLIDGQGFACHGTSASNRSWQLHQQFGNGQAVFQTYSDGTSGGGVASTTFGALSTGIWYFVVGSCSAAGLLSISVNAGTADTSARTTAFNTTDTFGCGWREDVSNVNYNLNGALAMFGLWKGRELADAERTFLFNGGSGLSFAQLAPSNLMGQACL